MTLGCKHKRWKFTKVAVVTTGTQPDESGQACEEALLVTFQVMSPDV